MIYQIPYSQLNDEMMAQLLRAAYRRGFADCKIGMPYLQVTDENLMKDCENFFRLRKNASKEKR